MRFAPEKIAEARISAGLGREKLARAVAASDPPRLGGTNALTIYRWERGQNRPRFESETVAAIAAATGKSVSFFFETDDDGGAASDDEEAAPVTVTFTVPGAPEDVVVALMARLQTPVGATR